MTKSVALTTSDNPYDPIDQYDDWYRFDSIEHDYGTDAYLDRITHTTTELGEELYLEDIEAAIDEAVKLNIIALCFDGISYKKVVHES